MSNQNTETPFLTDQVTRQSLSDPGGSRCWCAYDPATTQPPTPDLPRLVLLLPSLAHSLRQSSSEWRAYGSRVGPGTA